MKHESRRISGRVPSHAHLAEKRIRELERELKKLAKRVLKYVEPIDPRDEAILNADVELRDMAKAAIAKAADKGEAQCSPHPKSPPLFRTSKAPATKTKNP